jgi:hypothetical protein
MSNKKLAVSLGLRDKVEKDNTNMLNDMTAKFKNDQGKFLGFRNEYTALTGHPDDPTQRKSQVVVATVKEQLDWFKEHTKEYLDTVLSIEKTNAQGVKAPLVVGGDNWGEYTTLELLRLKGILDGKVKAMIQLIPIRNEGQRWKATTDPIYDGREVFEDEKIVGRTKTTIKRTVIVDDPHQTANPNIVRPPVTQSIDTPEETGEFAKQNFSGAWTNRQRAQLEVSYNTLYKGVIEALETANSIQLSESDLGDKVLGFLFK